MSPPLLLRLPDAPRGEAETVAPILLVVAHRFEPAVRKVCRTSTDDLEEVDAAGRHHALHGLRAARLSGKLRERPARDGLPTLDADAHKPHGHAGAWW